MTIAYADPERADKIRECLLACGRAGMQTPAMLALNTHVFGTHTRDGVGVEAAVTLLIAEGFDPPADPQQFSAPRACNILGVRP